MKKLTQAVFENAPDWIKSAAVDEDGKAWVWGVPRQNLIPTAHTGLWHTYKLNRLCPCEVIGTGYDTTDWQHSALDRE